MTARRHAQAHNERVQAGRGQAGEAATGPEEQKLSGGSSIGPPTRSAAMRAVRSPSGTGRSTSPPHRARPPLNANWARSSREVEHENDHERWTVEGELNPRPDTGSGRRLKLRLGPRPRTAASTNDRDYGFGM